MGDFSDFEAQGKQLSLILNGPAHIPEAFLKTLWAASEGGDASGRVERAINQLVAHLEKGDVPTDDGSGGGGAPKESPSKHSEASKKSETPKKKKKESKSKDKEKKSSKQPPPSPSLSGGASEGVFGAELGMAGMLGPVFNTAGSLPQGPGQGFASQQHMQMPASAPAASPPGWGAAPSMPGSCGAPPQANMWGGPSAPGSGASFAPPPPSQSMYGAPPQGQEKPWMREAAGDDSDTNSDDDWWNAPEPGGGGCARGRQGQPASGGGWGY